MRSTFLLMIALFLASSTLSSDARPPSGTDAVDKLATAVSEGFTTKSLGALDAQRPYVGTVKIVIEHSLSGRRETKTFKSLAAVERWLKRREREDGPARNSGPLLQCAKGVCEFDQNGLLHNNLYLQKVTYGMRKGRPYIKGIYILDGD